MDDLAYRWFMSDSSKKAKCPLVSIAYGKPLTWYVEQYPSSLNRAYQQWKVDFNTDLFYKPWDLKNLAGNATWDTTSAAATQYYGEWYDYFEGTIPSGGSGGTGGGIEPGQNIADTYILDSPVGEYLVNNKKKELDGNTITVNISNATKTLIDNDEIRPYRYILAYTDGDFTSSKSFVILFITNTQQLTLEQTTVSGNNPIRLTLSGYSNNRIYKKNSTYYYTVEPFTNNNLNVTFDITSQTNYGSTVNCLGYYWLDLQSGSSGGQQPDPEQSEPVYTPQGPVSVNYPESPTYNNYTYNDGTNIDLDELNHNMITGFQDIKETLVTWFDYWTEFTTAVYDDLTMYLYNIEQLLLRIYELMLNQPTTVPDFNNQITPQEQTEVNINALKGKFPFSLPWDCYTLITMLEAPSAPIVFDLPVIMTSYTVHIDCSAFEPMAAVSRKMSVLIFVMGLMVTTKNWLVVISKSLGG